MRFYSVIAHITFFDTSTTVIETESVRERLEENLLMQLRIPVCLGVTSTLGL